MVIGRWERYESENYLVHHDFLLRYIKDKSLPLFYSKAEEYLKDQLPAAVQRNPLQNHEFFKRIPASKTLIPEFFGISGYSISKKEYFLVASQMKMDEIPPEVRTKLDDIYQILMKKS